jgi:hypothetical protein
MVVLKAFWCCFLLIAVSSLNAVYTTAVHYKKDVKNNKGECQSVDVFVLCNVQIDPKIDTECCCETDHEQSVLLTNVLPLAAKSNKKIAFIIDAARSEVERAFDCFSEYKQEIYHQVGVHTFQAFIGLMRKGKIGSIDYCYSDNSGNALLCLLRSLEIIERHLQGCRFKSSDNYLSLFYPSLEQDDKKKRLIKHYGGVIKNELKGFVPDATVGQLKRKLEKTKKKFNGSALKDVEAANLIRSAQRFLESSYYENDMQVRDFIWKIFEERPLKKLQQVVHSWAYSLQNLLATRGFEIKLNKNLQEYQAIIISCDKNKIVPVHSLLRMNDFYINCSYQGQDKGALSSFDYSSLLDCFLDTVGR